MRLAVLGCVSVLLLGSLGVGCAAGSPPRAHPDANLIDADRPSDAADDGGTDAPAIVDAGQDAAPMIDADMLHCTAANASTVCGAHPCVDGVCCDSACEGPCRSCNAPGSEGTCTMYGGGTDPEDECATQASSTCGTTGSCDGAGACAQQPSSVTCDDGMACTTNDACDGHGTCHGAAPTACAPGAGNECCLGGCGASGCLTSAGTCADVCGGAMLSVMRTCNGCGAAGASGACQGGAIHQCDASSHVLCDQVMCGGLAYACTIVGGAWAWRTASACDDGNPCTYGDLCNAGSCTGAAITCTSTTCATLSCNGTSTCTSTPRTGTTCDDGNACTYGDACTAAGACGAGTPITCTSSACVDRACNGSSTCVSTPRTGMTCDDGNACTYGEICNAAGTCGAGTAVTCMAPTTCRTYACNGTSTCAAGAQNVGGACDDGNAATTHDVCRSDGSCMGSVCPPTLTTVFSDDFAMPSASAWTSGTDVVVTTSRWHATTTANHGVRITGGQLQITNARSSSPDHGQGYADVPIATAYDPSYLPTLDANTSDSIVWSLNMNRDDPEATGGGFSCSSTASQNDITVGLGYVLAASSATGLNASASTCNPSATASGYAVVMGGTGSRVRLVRFENGLRNGTLTPIVQSGTFSASTFFSVRVTYNTATHLWTLETRSDGTSAFANPAAGTYSFTGTGTDATHTGESLGYSGPYFQTGCSGLCESTYTARFDNVSVGLRCAP